MATTINNQINKVELTEKPLISNVVSTEKLRYVQTRVLDDIEKIILKTYGPQGSNTLIINGIDKDSCKTDYTKDGKTVLEKTKYYYPLEAAITHELQAVADFTEKTVGDGTSTAIILSAEIFKGMCNLNYNNPFELIRVFKKIVKEMQEGILSSATEFNPAIAYNIAYVSTNGNEEIALLIQDLYEKYGNNLNIDVKLSINENTYVNEYDGIVGEVGYSDQMYINKSTGECELDNAEIYIFGDPVDTPEMINFYEQIILNNIYNPLRTNQPMVPTVIIADRLSRDLSPLMKKIGSLMYNYNKTELINQKPPLCVIANTGIYQAEFEDIADLCGARKICKYINPKIQEEDVKKGLAPDLDTIGNFCGHVTKFVANATKCKFIEPENMYDYTNVKEDGYPTPSDTYIGLLNFLELELNNAAKNGLNTIEIGSLKRRVNNLKGNMIELFVGGISDSERLSLKRLLDDATLNCQSAAKNGVGYAASFEGYNAIKNLYLSNYPIENVTSIDDNIYKIIINIIYKSYTKVIDYLYEPWMNKTENDHSYAEIMYEKGCPYNILTGEFDEKVQCSIMTDYTVLEAISRIITIMFTCNQVLLQDASVNVYKDK